VIWIWKAFTVLIFSRQPRVCVRFKSSATTQNCTETYHKQSTPAMVLLALAFLLKYVPTYSLHFDVYLTYLS